MINIDILSQLKAIDREVSRQTSASGETVTVLLRRGYPTTVEDLWDAMTDPDRIKRWFMPVTGDLRVGGSFQLQGNAGGDILTCEPPRLLRLTFGGPTSLVELRLRQDSGDDTLLELEHTVPIEMARSGAGALYVGPGWDGALMGLGLHITGEFTGDPTVAANSIEVQEFSRQSIDVWAAVVAESGTATTDEISAATEVSLAQFSPDVIKGAGS
jgi:uncharacterized protein YndB with AHSA1/START domain